MEHWQAFEGGFEMRVRFLPIGEAKMSTLSTPELLLILWGYKKADTE